MRNRRVFLWGKRFPRAALATRAPRIMLTASLYVYHYLFSIARKNKTFRKIRQKKKRKGKETYRTTVTTANLLVSLACAHAAPQAFNVYTPRCTSIQHGITTARNRHPAVT